MVCLILLVIVPSLSFTTSFPSHIINRSNVISVYKLHFACCLTICLDIKPQFSDLI